MPTALSADGLRRAMRVRIVLQAATFTPPQKMLLLALNAWPLAHVAGAFALATLLPAPGWVRVLAVGSWVLLLPPFLSRLVVGSGLPAGKAIVPSPDFFRWWATWQLQMLFNRMLWIEETLRLVPGLYSFWLRLWGARIGRLTLWSPGVRVCDRPLLVLGDDVVVGLDVRLVGHYGGLDPRGCMALVLGPITIGSRTTLGGGAMIGPGCILESDQTTAALFIGLPFTRWRDGQLVSTADDFQNSSNSQP